MLVLYTEINRIILLVARVTSVTNIPLGLNVSDVKN